MPQITELTIHPVKSLRGIELESARMTPWGLEHDRRFMLVNENGRFQTQRDIPRLALIRTVFEEGGVSLFSDGHGSVLLPFEPRPGAELNTAVWGEPCEVTDLGDAVADWVTEAAHSAVPLRVVRMRDGFVRQQGQPELLGEATRTLFADAAPYLVANQASLDRLNRALLEQGHRPVRMNRFRPNIVVDGLPPFAEHQVRKLAGAAYQLTLHAPCERCVVTTIDQESAQRHPDRQPLRTLQTLNPMPGRAKAAAFAQYASLTATFAAPTIRVGDSLEADFGTGQAS